MAAKISRINAVRDNDQDDQRENGSFRRRVDAANGEWQMARTIVSSLILAGVIGLVTLVVSMQNQQAKDREDGRVQSATIIAQIANIQYNTSDVPAMRANQVRMDAVQVEILRRLNADDEAFMRLGVYPAKAKQ